MSDNDVPAWPIGALIGLITGGPAGAFIGALMFAATEEPFQSVGTGSSTRGSHDNTNTGGARSQTYHRTHTNRNTSGDRSQTHHRNHTGNNRHRRPRTDPWLNEVPNLPTAVHNAFRALGLKPGATLEQVKKRFHVLARRHHPDMYEGPGTDPQLRAEAQARFIGIKEAYQVLNEYIANRG